MLREAAKAVPKKPQTQGVTPFKPDGSADHSYSYHCRGREDYERARAEFWRLAFEWRDGPNGYGPLLGDYDKGMKIISEVESRT